MRGREREVVLGAIVFLAVVTLVAGTTWLSERYAGAAGGYQLQVLFDSVPGLQRGSAVTIRGVKVGKVLRIALEAGQPVVTIGFESLDRLPHESRILLKSDGLLGGKMIEVQPAADRGQAYEDGDTIRGITGGGIEALSDSAAMLARRFNAAMMQAMSEENLTHLQNLLARMDSSAGHLRQMLQENRGTVSGLLDTLSQASGEARGMLGENRAEVRKTVRSLRRSTERLAAMSEDMQDASASLKKVLADLGAVSERLRAGEGTLGRLLQDEGIYQSLDRTLVSVDSLLEGIKRDPGRYIKFEFHLF